MINLYRLSPLSESTVAIDTLSETVDVGICADEEIVSTIGDNGLCVGEMDSQELSYTLLDAKTRHIVQLTVGDIERTNQMFNDLYGKDVEPRVRYIEAHGEELSYD